jgi:hypothetical protein
MSSARLAAKVAGKHERIQSPQEFLAQLAAQDAALLRSAAMRASSPPSTPGPFNRIARNHFKAKHSARHWDDLLRLAGSLTEGRVAGSEVLRLLQSDVRYSTLGRAMAEYGRLAKPVLCTATTRDPAWMGLPGSPMVVPHAISAIAARMQSNK